MFVAARFACGADGCRRKNGMQKTAPVWYNNRINDLKDENKMTRILFVCHGNICRSTMAEFVMKDMVKKEALAEQFEIDSAATSTEEIGNGVHPGTRRKLAEKGVPCGEHRARQMERGDYDRWDYLIGMDSANIRNMNRICGGDRDGKIHKLLSFAGSGADVADPWYTGDFEATWRDVTAGCAALLEQIKKENKDAR